MFLGDSRFTLVDGFGETARYDRGDRGSTDISSIPVSRQRRVNAQAPGPQKASKTSQGIQITPGMVTTSLILAAFGFPLAPLAGFIPGLRKVSDGFGNTVNSGLKSTFNFFKDTFNSLLGIPSSKKKYVRTASPDTTDSTKQNSQGDSRARIVNRDQWQQDRNATLAERKGFFGTVGSGVLNGLETVGSTLGRGFEAVGGAIGSGVKSVGSAVGGFFGKLFGGGSNESKGYTPKELATLAS